MGLRCVACDRCLSDTELMCYEDQQGYCNECDSWYKQAEVDFQDFLRERREKNQK